MGAVAFPEAGRSVFSLCSLSPAARRVPSLGHIPVAPQAPVPCAGHLHTPILQKDGTGNSLTSGTGACFHVIPGAGALRMPRGRSQALETLRGSGGWELLFGVCHTGEC